MKKIISLILSALMLSSVLSFGATTALASAVNTAATAEVIGLNAPVSVLFRYGYPTGEYKSYISETEKYFKFTAPSTDYYDFKATGYEATVYDTGKTPSVSISVQDSYGKSVGSVYTNDVTLETRKGIQLTQGQTYIIDLTDSMYNIASYASSTYGYAEQNITLSVTSHVHDWYVDGDYTYTTYYSCHYCNATYTVDKTAKKPSKPSIKSLKLAKKKATISWKAVSGATSYQIQYGTKKNFKGAKTLTVYTNKFSGKLPNYKKGKKYYVRIRAVNAAGKSAWSAAKSTKAK